MLLLIVSFIFLSLTFNIKLNALANQDKTSGQFRNNIKPGYRVELVQKQHQRSGQLTEGIVSKLLTKSAQHPHGIKVMLDSGIVGRVKYILSNEE